MKFKFEYNDEIDDASLAINGNPSDLAYAMESFGIALRKFSDKNEFSPSDLLLPIIIGATETEDGVPIEEPSYLLIKLQEELNGYKSQLEEEQQNEI